MQIIIMFGVHLAYDVQTFAFNIYPGEFFYSGISALRYFPGTSKVATFLPYCPSIMRLENRFFRDIN